MTGRGDEVQTEAFEIVERIAQSVDFKLAAIARAGVDFADRKAAPETASRIAFEAFGQFGKRGIVRRGRRFGERSMRETFKERLAHQKSCPEYEQLNDLLQSGKSATILPSMAVSRSGH